MPELLSYGLHLKYLGRSGVDELGGWYASARQMNLPSSLMMPAFEILNDVVFNQVIVSPSS